MILVNAVIMGLIMGLTRLWINGTSPNAPHFKLGWLIVIAGIPQVLFFHTDAFGSWPTDAQAAWILILTQLLLLTVAFMNGQYRGMKALCIGLLLNFVVIVANGGFMPIRPEAILELVPQATPEMIDLGSRLGTGKDIILPLEVTRLWWLSDYFILADWFPYRVAYSIGDLFIAFGAWRILWEVGRAEPRLTCTQNPISLVAERSRPVL